MAVVGNLGRSSRAESRGLLARHPLTSYFVIAYLFSWLIEVPVALSAQGMLPALPKPMIALAVVAATFGPTVGAFVMTGVTEGGEGVVRLLRRYVHWRVGIVWYLFLLVGVPIIIVLGTIVVPGALSAFQPIVGPLLAAYPLAFLMTFLLGGPLGEEPGWRGFALPRLQERHGPLVGSVILGLLWAFWHFPLFWSGVWTPPTAGNMVMFVVMITALTIMMTWVFNHAAGSLLITMLMHASFNTFANKVGAPLFPAPIFNDYGLLPVLIGFTVTAVVLIVVTRGRLGLPKGARSPGLATPSAAPVPAPST
ncbi:CPBP family intramembrane glutamic endopeptidase [Microbacterium sp. MYb64]|uniref:CPBP family intramembrane glutamic endopeptidase n=1 Tax=Microbacterium sp. MYb64 TaxID=1848691 RepID=UPI000CFC50D7|nr:type II CAAX endopeptidase family protein [Microbacterium sp. MYb64]PRB05797.1 CPBP family intramembrane metalloprotease domain-containing protein [Microbacterium sp. MYb64]